MKEKPFLLMILFVVFYVPNCLGQKLDIDTFCNKKEGFFVKNSGVFIYKDGKYEKYKGDVDSNNTFDLYHQCAIMDGSYLKFSLLNFGLYRFANNTTGNKGHFLNIQLDLTLYYSRFLIGFGGTSSISKVYLFNGLDFGNGKIPNPSKKYARSTFYKIGYSLFEDRKISFEPYMCYNFMNLGYYDSSLNAFVGDKFNKAVRGFGLGFEFNILMTEPIIIASSFTYDFNRYSSINQDLGNGGMMFKVGMFLKTHFLSSKRYYSKIN